MLIATSIAEANERRQVVDVHGQEYLLREFVGAVPRRGTYVEGNEANDNGHPQGFLVSQPPGSVTPPHFHETNQFQVFVGGSGRLGKRRADPVTVQFAGGHTPYGPIAAEDRGIRYFTLRQAWDPGAKYMPAMRGRLVRGPPAPAPRAEGGAAGRGGPRRPRRAGGRDAHRPRGGRDGGGARAPRAGHANVTPLRRRRAVPGGHRGDPRARWRRAVAADSPAGSRPRTSPSANSRPDRAASPFSPSSSPPFRQAREAHPEDGRSARKRGAARRTVRSAASSDHALVAQARDLRFV